jgi:hypothetical protein
MKRILTLTLLGVVFSISLAACGTKKRGKCDAYGSIQKVENTDVAHK